MSLFNLNFINLWFNDFTKDIYQFCIVENLLNERAISDAN